MPSPHKARKRVTPSLASSPRRGKKVEPTAAPGGNDSSSSDDDDILEVMAIRPSPKNRASKAKMGIQPTSPAKRRLAPVLETVKTPTIQNPAESEDDEYSEDDEDLDENDLTPTLAELASQCWTCQVTLKLPPPQFCMYSLHVHPILKTPTCSVCVDDLANISEEDDEICHGCAGEGETLLLCDNCPRAFCKTCVAQAYGGGRIGHKAVQRLEGEDGEWKCPACDPSPALKQIQDELEPTTSLDEDGPQRSLEVVVDELKQVESEKEDCIRLLEDPEAYQARRDEVANEIRTEKPNLSEKKLQALLDDEMRRWKEEYVKHDHLLGDKVAELQEELEVIHKVDLVKLYHHLFETNEQKAGEVEEEPDYKRKADEEISRRMMSQPQTTLRKVFDQEVYEREWYEDVEDLQTRPEDERECPGVGFRSTQERPSARQIQEATEEEDRMLAERKVKIRTRIDDATDEQYMVNEEKETSQQGVGGVRVRRDTIVLNQQLNVRRKKAPPKPNSAPPPAAAKTAPPPVENAPGEPKTMQADPKLEKASPQATAAAAGGEVVDLTDGTPIVTLKMKAKATKDTIKKALNFKRPSPVYTLQLDEEYEDDVANEKETDEEEYYCSSDLQYKESDLILSSPETFHSTSGKRVKTISVSTELTKHLKSHQREGVKFIWSNACVDFNVRTSRDEEVPKTIGGCILAHSMGLGKSLTAIATMHTMLNHPSMRCKEGGRRLVQSILLVVPVNTIASWKSEFSKWAREIMVYDFSEHHSASREIVVNNWMSEKWGGVLIVSKESFQKSAAKLPKLQKADVIFIDEAHQCLANQGNAIYKALEGVESKRRVLLTGTPFQNNALEYYRMISFIRKDVLDRSESAFEKEYAKPIAQGMPSDASPAAVKECALKSAQLKKILSPYVHRKDSTVLRESLPPMQQVILHLRPTKTQTQLYTALKRHEQRNDITNFFHRYHLARPLHNHPACLEMKPRSEDPEESELLEIDEKNKDWWAKYFEKNEQKARAVNAGSKVVIFLHILSHAIQVGDKVVLFSQCLKTLDFIEEVLQKENWSKHVKSLKHDFPNQNLGGWQRNKEYLRIDGATESKERGNSVQKFQKEAEGVQLFLISSKAGGVGITLTAANRVILFDSHFNPVVNDQALARCYRFGQEKPVFVYRFLTEGTGEEKIYSRSVNKSGLSLRVIDGKNFKGAFTEKELEALVETDTWVQCDKCEKWRMLKGVEEEDVPDTWHCSMNRFDTVNNNCDAPEKDTRWYHTHFQLKTVDLGHIGEGANAGGVQHEYKIMPGEQASVDDASDPSNDVNKEALKRKDVVLTKLLDDGASSKGKANKSSPCNIISKWYFHDALLDAPEDLETEIPEEETVPDGDLKPAAKKKAPSAASEKDNKQKPRGEGGKVKESKKRSTEAPPSHQTPTPSKKAPMQGEPTFSITRVSKLSGSSARKPGSQTESNQSAKKCTTTVRQENCENMVKKESPSAGQTKKTAWTSPSRTAVHSPKRKQENDGASNGGSANKRARRQDKKRPPPPDESDIIDLMDSDSGDEN